MLDKALAGAVGGVSLAGEDKLYGTLLVVDDLSQAVKVVEEKVCAFVCGETTCESEDQAFGLILSMICITAEGSP